MSSDYQVITKQEVIDATEPFTVSVKIDISEKGFLEWFGQAAWPVVVSYEIVSRFWRVIGRVPRVRVIKYKKYGEIPPRFKEAVPWNEGWLKAQPLLFILEREVVFTFVKEEDANFFAKQINKVLSDYLQTEQQRYQNSELAPYRGVYAKFIKEWAYNAGS